MMIKSIHHSLSLTLFIFLLFSSSSAHNKTKDGDSSSSPPPSTVPQGDDAFKGCFPKVFAFGDSDADTGNAPLIGAHVENGFALNVSTVFPTRLVVDFLCAALSLPPLPAFKSPLANSKTGVSFAVTGSTSLTTEFFAPKNITSLFWKGVPQSFQTQIDWFNKYLKEMKGKSQGPIKADMANALFWIGQLGVSDYASAAGSGSSISLQALAESSVKHVCDIVKNVISNGGKYIVVQGLLPLGCCPLYMALSRDHKLDDTGCAAAMNTGIMIHNSILKWSLNNFRKMYPHSTILYADTWSAYLEIMKNPKKYQIEEPFKACCGSGEGHYNFDKNKLCGSSGASVCKDPQKYMNWDGVRLTEAMHKHLIDMFLHEDFCHPSFAEPTLFTFGRLASSIYTLSSHFTSE